MALTRSYLKGMGITDEQVEAIIEAHTEVTNVLKAQRDDYKEKAEKLDDVQKELDSLKTGDNDWKTKYEKEHSDFEAFKTAQAEKDTLANKSEAYKALLTEAKVTDKAHKMIIKGTDFSAMELDENGKLKDADKLMENIKSEYADWITQVKEGGAPSKVPPENDGGNTFDKMTLGEKMAYANANPSAPEVKAWLNA